MTEPRVGGYDWRQEIVTIIQREKAEVKTLQTLMKHAKTPETCALLADLLASKIETIDDLHNLHRYKGRKDE